MVEKELMSGRVAEEMTGERNDVRRAPRAANLTGTVTRTKEALETKAKAKARPILLRLRRARAYRSELSMLLDRA